jgi:acyl-CoA synthetase (AMP-forming)/AMP-acid ligase II
MGSRTRGSDRWQDVVRFGDVVLRAREQFGEREAVVFPGRRLTYAEVQERSFGVARSLLGLGCGPGSRVGLLMPNCPEFVELLFGISLIGAVVVPINSRFAPRELGYVVENADLDVLVTSDAFVDHVDYVRILQDALPGLADRPAGSSPGLDCAPALRAIVLIGQRDAPGMISRVTFDRFGHDQDDATVLALHRRTAVRDIGLVMYTSGTTAMPKGCLLTHEALVRPGFGFGRTKYLLEPDDRFWDPLPMFHLSAIMPLIATFDAGGAFLSMAHFEPGPALDMIEDERATVIYPSFPAVTQALLNHPEYHPDRLRSVRIALNVAPADMLRDMQARMPHTVQISCYGLTEGGGAVAINDVDDTLEQRCTTCGTPLEGMEVEIRDLETGAPVATGERGEIVVRGPGAFSGYHEDPERTAETIDADGWVHTGDIGAIDASGRIVYLGRTKDMLKVGGENVAAIEIESLIAQHPAVTMVAVVGVPDPKYLEVAAAFVELRPGAEATEAEIIEHCRAGLARFKVPRYVRFVTEWPTSATKVQKFRLQQALTEELEQARSVTA